MIEVRNLTKQKPSGLAWKKIKDYVLGEKYELSLVFAGGRLLKELNKKHRKKDRPADILSFALSKNQGEIFLNLKSCREKNYLTFIYIHGLLHLKGLSHGVKMKNKEQTIMKKLGIKNYGQ